MSQRLTITVDAPEALIRSFSLHEQCGAPEIQAASLAALLREAGEHRVGVTVSHSIDGDEPVMKDAVDTGKRAARVVKKSSNVDFNGGCKPPVGAR